MHLIDERSKQLLDQRLDYRLEILEDLASREYPELDVEGRLVMWKDRKFFRQNV